MKIRIALAGGALLIAAGCGAPTTTAEPVGVAGAADLTTTVRATTTAPPTTTTVPPTTTTTVEPPPPPPPPPAPKPPPAPVTTVKAAPPPKPANSCDPNYTGCVPIDSDVDCAGGSGNGPSYVTGPVTVIGSDIYGLDRDGDGIGCE